MAKQKARVNFYAESYEFSHGHAPRGRGGWMFEFTDAETGDHLVNETLPDGSQWHAENFNGTFGEAKSKARARARELAAKRGIDEVDVAVCP